jgi:hypothetical protein
MIEFNENTLRILWIAGISLSIIAIFLLGYVITIFEAKISDMKNEIADMEYKREVRIGQNWKEYLHYTLKRDIARLTGLTMNSNGYSSNDIKPVHDEYLEAQRRALSRLYIVLHGNIAPKEVSDKWENMDIEQLIAEDKKMHDGQNFNDLIEKIKLKKDKLGGLENWINFLIKVAIIIQVLGLILINIADFLKKQ